MKLWLAAGNGDLTFTVSARIIQSPDRKTTVSYTHLARARGRADQREFGQVEPDAPR